MNFCEFFGGDGSLDEKQLIYFFGLVKCFLLRLSETMHSQYVHVILTNNHKMVPLFKRLALCYLMVTFVFLLFDCHVHMTLTQSFIAQYHDILVPRCIFECLFFLGWTLNVDLVLVLREKCVGSEMSSPTENLTSLSFSVSVTSVTNYIMLCLIGCHGTPQLLLLACL